MHGSWACQTHTNKQSQQPFGKHGITRDSCQEAANCQTSEDTSPAHKYIRNNRLRVSDNTVDSSRPAFIHSAWPFLELSEKRNFVLRRGVVAVASWVSDLVACAQNPGTSSAGYLGRTLSMHIPTLPMYIPKSLRVGE